MGGVVGNVAFARVEYAISTDIVEGQNSMKGEQLPFFAEREKEDFITGKRKADRFPCKNTI